MGEKKEAYEGISIGLAHWRDDYQRMEL